MLSRHERIEGKAKALEQLDPEREVKLDGAFKNHLADAVRSSSPRERQLKIEKAIEAYEDALDGALYELLDKHVANEDSSLA